MDEIAFLAQIQAHPGDPGPLLVFADWLDERGDPRGPMLREMVRAELPGGVDWFGADHTAILGDHDSGETGLLDAVMPSWRGLVMYVHRLERGAEDDADEWELYWRAEGKGDAARLVGVPDANGWFCADDLYSVEGPEEGDTPVEEGVFLAFDQARDDLIRRLLPRADPDELIRHAQREAAELSRRREEDEAARDVDRLRSARALMADGDDRRARRLLGRIASRTVDSPARAEARALLSQMDRQRGA